MPRFIRRMLAGSLFLMSLLLASGTYAQETIRIGYVDPLSGAFAQQGDASLQHFA